MGTGTGRRTRCGNAVNVVQEAAVGRWVGPDQFSQPKIKNKNKNKTERQRMTYNSAESSSFRTRRRRSIARTEGWCQSSVMSSALACSIRVFGSRSSLSVSLDRDEKEDRLAFGSSWCDDLERRSARLPNRRVNCQPLRTSGVP